MDEPGASSANPDFRVRLAASRRIAQPHLPHPVLRHQTVGCGRVRVRGSMVAGRRLAMNRWFLNTHREWVQLIIAAVLLWLLMMVAISELELRTVS
jgi:hypothetical protein